jgi:lipid A 3-O-deacylase
MQVPGARLATFLQQSERKRMKTCLTGAVLACAALASGAASAIDGVAVELGRGNGTDMARIAVQSDWQKQWFRGSDWHVGGYWDLGVGQWHHGSVAAGQNEDITEIGLTPVFRLQQNDKRGLYGEAGIGFHLLSRTSIGDKRFSTAFQFGDHIGVGYRFGAKGAYDVSYRFQHLSNGGIKQPNNGINFSQIRLQYHF